MLVRVIREAPAVTQQEERLFFGAAMEPNLSPWLGIKLALFSIMLFLVGIAEGLILINIGFPWMLLAPLGTTLGMMFILAWWLRSAANQNSLREQDAAELHGRQNRTPGMLSQ
jgi:hypothetical protein